MRTPICIDNIYLYKSSFQMLKITYLRATISIAYSLEHNRSLTLFARLSVQIMLNKHVVAVGVPVINLTNDNLILKCRFTRGIVSPCAVSRLSIAFMLTGTNRHSNLDFDSRHSTFISFDESSQQLPTNSTSEKTGSKIRTNPNSPRHNH